MTPSLLSSVTEQTDLDILRVLFVVCFFKEQLSSKNGTSGKQSQESKKKQKPFERKDVSGTKCCSDILPEKD